MGNAMAATKLPIPYFVFAFACLGTAAIALPFFAADVLAQHHYTQRTVAFTHLVSLGWITSVILGSAVQLVPVALGTKLYSTRLPRWGFWLHVIGVSGMVASFWVWNFHWLLWFGSSFTLGLILFIYNMLRSIKKAPVRDVVSVHISTALFYLVLTFLAGQYLMHDKVISFSPFHVLCAIHAHAHLAVLGWFFMMIIGVSYRLIPMFTLSKIQSPRRIWTGYAALNLGIPMLFVGLLLQQNWTWIAAVPLMTGLGCWFFEMQAVYRMRQRPALDEALKQMRIAIFHLPILAAFGFWLALPEAAPSAWKAQAQTGYGILALFGFVTLFIMAVMYKIVPFLVWYQIYPPLIGKQSVPSLSDLFSHRLQKISCGIFLAGIWATVISSSLGEKIPLAVIQSAASLMGLGLILFVANMGWIFSKLNRSCPIAMAWLQIQKWWTGTTPLKIASPHKSP